MESYKQEKIIIIMYEYLNDKREFYPISNVPLDKAKFFYKDDDGLFKLMAVSDYTVKTELNENRLYIVNAAIKDNSEKFQIGYEINFKAAEYESPLPVLSVLTKMYNQLIEDTRILHSYIRKQCFVADGKEQALVLPGLPAHTVWCMGENGKMFALPVSELYNRFNQMVEALKKEFEKVLIAGADEALIEIIKKFKEETDKQLGILAGAGSAFKPKQVANIEILKNVNAKVDEVYEVLGYYRFDDGANHKRKIAREDDGSGVQLANGMWANILHNGEIHVDWFGTVGDGRNEQPIFSKISKYIKNLNTNGLKLIFPKGKVFEYGDQVENDKHSSTTPFYKTTNGIVVQSKTNFDIEVDLNSCTFNKKEGCRFGSFNPLTGEKHPSSGTFLKSEYQTNAPSFLILSGMNNVKVANGTVDGKRETDIIGGTWGDAGWQLWHYGVHVTDIKESIILDNLIIVNQNTDAIVAGGLGIDSYKHTLITNTRINNCGRQGITLSGGKNMFLDNITITNIGIKTPTTEVASNPKAGIDIENHTSYPINNFSITNSHIENCGNNCIVNDGGGKAHQIEFGKIINCKLINKNSNILWLYGSEFEMYNSVIVGKILYFQKNNKNGGRIQSCYITDDPSEYSLLGDNTPQDADTVLLENSINLYNCTINLKKENRKYFDWHSVNYYDCIFSSVSDLEVLGKIIGGNFDKSKKRIFGETYSRFMETFSFVLHTNIYKERSIPTKIIKYLIPPNFNANRGDIVLANDILSNGCYGRICSVGGNGENIPTTLKLSGTSGSNIFTAKADKNGDKIAYISCSNLFYGIASIKNIKYLRKEEELSVYEYTLDKNSTQTLEDAVATAPKAVWKELRYFVENQVSTLNTPYYADKMKEEGVYNDFKTYMDKKIPYDKQQQKQEEQNQLAYQESFKENPNLTYEEFLSMQPMTLNLIASEEPQPSEALKKFMEKYL